MDASTLKLAKRLRDLERQKSNIAHEIDSIATALAVAGMRLKSGFFSGHELQYEARKPFANLSLSKSCQKVLHDHKKEWLSKSEIEYLVMRGGYPFATDNSRNSVGVTLQRMIGSGKDKLTRARGPQGTRYRLLNTEEESKKAAAHMHDRRKTA